ncbi:RAMP superfamily CRISPR-associated protein [Haloimpatiens sp. FM7330]|uniref:RAMP superfamily CRISPR-associated protein n=1 Tax=Haloimpatiens sp. FM7330 TaxID=3298610 RepID=UPI0036438BFD
MGKPYSFVPLLGKKNYKVMDKELYRGKIKLKITTITPLYIARAEIWEKDNKKLRKRFYQINNKYLIPGSSLKGVVRTIAESVSYSCIKTRQNRNMNMIKKEHVSNKKCNCIVCKTFGEMFYKSKVIFKDFVFKKGDTYTKCVPKLMNPHPEKGFYKENGKFKGVKFYYHGTNQSVENGSIPVEAMKPNSCFEGEVLFQELDKEQLKLLCFSLGLDGSIQLKLGYNKPGYFGSCKVESMKAEIGKIKGLETIEKQFDAKELACQWGKQDDKILDNINKLREILSYENARKISDWQINENGQKSY